MLNTNDTVDGPTAGEPARWSIAGMFLEGLTARDYDRLATTLAPRRAIPGAPAAADRPSGTAEPKPLTCSARGSAQADRFEVVDATVGEIAGRLQMTWRIRLRPAPFDIGDGWHLIEQHAFADIAETIETLDLVCSGFRAERTSA